MILARFLLAASLVLIGTIPAGAATNVAASSQRIEQPRPFGHAIGDILVQRIHLNLGGQRFFPAELPRAERVGLSLWRREVRQEKDADGEHWLVLRYQIINSPQSLAVWELPALQLKSADSAAILATPPWSFSIGPFTPAQAFDKANLPALRDDHPPQKIALAPLDRRIVFAVGGLALMLLLWGSYAFWLHLKSSRHMPFARAMRDMRLMQENSPAAWRRLQHALNDAAGQVVRANTLDRLIERTPYLAQERDALEQFCRESSALFFGSGLPADAAAAHQLASRLRRLERRHAS
jgi:mxaA protein